MSSQSWCSSSELHSANLSSYIGNSMHRFCNRQTASLRHGLSQAWAIVLLAAALMLAGSTGALGQAPVLQPGWNQLSPANNPGPRFLATITYDAAHSQVVLFSGNDASNDTWLWNGTDWSQASASSQSSPPARWSAAMVYDAADRNVVLFGGDENGTLGQDTWLWNGSSWTQASPANSPTPRDNCMMVYDAAQGEVVLFGGNVNGAPVNDTWVWQGGNWTNVTPADPSSSPSARQMYSMAYDSALGEVILFGGSGSGGNLSDTWAWNGTSWTQLNPANIPPGRYAQGMAYNPALNQVVMFGGTNGSYLGDTWVFDGSNWTEVSSPANLQARLAFNGMVYDSAIEQVILYSGLSPLVDTWEFGSPSNFGNINVCPSSATTPAPCQQSLTLTYNVLSTTTFGTPQVVTQGAASLDFTLASGGACTGTISAGSTCTVNVTFAPKAPGLRAGAVRLFDNGGNLLTTSLISGIGQAPAMAFGPGTQSVVNTGSYSLTAPKGIAVDAVGDVFIVDTHNHTGDGRVIKIANGTQTTVGVGLSYPQGLAVDGAGDLFVADNDLNEVVEVPAGCASAACQKTVGSGLSAQLGVAVDGAGDVFIGDFTGHEVAKVPANGGTQTVVYSPGTNSSPVGLAVDAAGDLFVADYGLHEIVEVPAGCASSSCQTTVGSGWSQVEGVAVDAAGDVFVTDIGLDEVVEIPAGCNSSSCQIAVASGIESFGVAANAAGDVFVADANNNRALEINRSQPPSLSFATTNAGSTSSDSPQSITALNVGNQPLNAISPGLAVAGPNFVQVAGPGAPADCSSTFSLAPGGECNLSIGFEPQSGGPLNSTAVFSDNSLNAAPATQTIALSGTGVATTYTLTVTNLGTGNGAVTDNTGAINCTISNGSVTGTCSASYQSGTVVQLTAAAAAGSVFAGWNGTAQTALSSISLTMNAASAVSASFSPQSFANTNVCPTGQSTPAPCSSTIAVTLNVYENTTLGVIQVVTQGVAGLDFSQASGGTCTGAITSGSSCVVNVKFTPLAPGLRMGAVNLYDENGNLAASSPVYGVGQAPAAAFSPSAQIPISTGSFTLSQPKGLLIDAAGNLFVSDTTKQEVLKIAPSGSVSSLGSGFQFPQGMAEDGAGDLFVADNNLNQVVEIPAGCASSACQRYVPNPLTLRSQLGVAVDGAGDLFIGDFEENKVAEVPANGGPQTIVYNPNPGCGTGNSCPHPVDLTTDAAGDLFIADFGLQKVVEVPAGCTSAACQKTIGSGWSQPDGVAVDAAGDVFVADAGLDEVVEVPAGCATSACQVVMVSWIDTVAVKVDPSGDLVVDNLAGPQVFEVTRSLPPSLSFALTNVGSTSTDSPQLVSIQNVGNQPLSGTLALNLGTSFASNAASTCGSGFTLVPGSACSESFSFIPSSTGYQTGSASFSDNSMNLSSSVSLETISLSGNGGLNGQPVGVQVPNVVGLPQAAATTSITGTGLAEGTVSTASSSVVPSGDVIASNPSAGTVVNPGSAVRLLVSTGQAPPPTPNPLSLLNNYFVTGDYAEGGVALRGKGVGGMASGTITIADSTTSPGAQGVPDGADIIDGFLYWMTLENTVTASGNTGKFLGYPITGQQIGSDIPYTDGTLAGTLRVYRADVNTYFPGATNGSGVRTGSGAFTVSLPDSGGSTLPVTEGASLVVIYRVMSQNFPLKSIVIYDGSAVPTTSTTQNMQGFYDALGGTAGESTTLSYAGGSWNNSFTSVSLAAHAAQYSAPLNAGAAYAAVILCTPVTNSDNDGILDAWKAGPAGGDFYAGAARLLRREDRVLGAITRRGTRRKGSLRSARLHVRRRAGQWGLRSQPGESVSVA